MQRRRKIEPLPQEAAASDTNRRLPFKRHRRVEKTDRLFSGQRPSLEVPNASTSLLLIEHELDNGHNPSPSATPCNVFVDVSSPSSCQHRRKGVFNEHFSFRNSETSIHDDRSSHRALSEKRNFHDMVGELKEKRNIHQVIAEIKEKRSMHQVAGEFKEKRNFQQVIGELKAKAMQRKVEKSTRENNPDAKQRFDSSPKPKCDSFATHGIDSSPSNIQDSSINDTLDSGTNSANRRKFHLIDRNVQSNFSSWLVKAGRMKSSTPGESHSHHGPATQFRRSSFRMGLGRSAGLNTTGIAPEHRNVVETDLDGTRSMMNLGELFAHQGKNLGPRLRQIGRDAKDVLRRTKSSHSLYNHHDSYMDTRSDPLALEEYTMLTGSIQDLEQRMENAEKELHTFLDNATRQREQIVSEVTRLTKLCNSLKNEQEVKFRSVLDIFNENHKTLGYVESNFDYLLSVVDRGRRQGVREYVIRILQFLGDNTMDKIFYAIHAASEMLMRIRRTWNAEIDGD